MLSLIPGFIDRYLDRFISRDAAQRRGLGFGRGCAVVMPFVVILWVVIVLVGYFAL